MVPSAAPCHLLVNFSWTPSFLDLFGLGRRAAALDGADENMSFDDRSDANCLSLTQNEIKLALSPIYLFFFGIVDGQQQKIIVYQFVVMSI